MTDLALRELDDPNRQRQRVDTVQHSASVSILRMRPKGFSISAGAGVLAPGMLRRLGHETRLRAGGSLAFGLSRPLLPSNDALMFLVMSLVFSVSLAATDDPEAGRGLYFANDTRLGFAFGKTFWNVLSPYVGARVFGGPVLWTQGTARRIGQDPEHYTLAAGAVVTMPRNLELTIDLGLAGARGVTAGFGASF